MLNRAFHIIDPLVAIARKARAMVSGSRLYRDTRGAVAIYVAITGALLLGGGVLAIDVGRMVVVRAELQNAADGAALSAALQLNGTAGARARAMSVVNDVIALESQLVEGSGAITATITNADFFELYEVATGIRDVAEGDSDAAFVRVVLDAEQLNFVLTGVLELVSSAGLPSFANMTTYAVAEYVPTTCEPVALMVCDVPGSAESVGDPDNAGRVYGITASPGAPLDSISGNFGLLDTGSGAAAVLAALAGDAGLPCNSGEPPVTEPGAQIGPVTDGLNARFGDNPPGATPATAATSIVEYPEDPVMVALGDGLIGDGKWDPNDYFDTTHCDGAGNCALGPVAYVPGGPAGLFIPPELQTALNTDTDATYAAGEGTGGAYVGPKGQHLPTRYQTYLWEVGETFRIRGGKTEYPAAASAGAGWTTVNPVAPTAANGTAAPGKYAGTNAPHPVVDRPPIGQASTAEMNGFTNYCIDPPLSDEQCQTRHRTILAVVVDCQTLSGNGKVTVTGVNKYVRFFIINKVPATGPGSNRYIRGELVGIEGVTGAGDELATGAISGNVRLVD